MPKLRKWTAYRNLEPAYTRRSKFRKKAYIKVNPNRGIVRFIMGDQSPKLFKYSLYLRSAKDIQLRNFAVEAGRQCGNRILEKEAGKLGYRMQVRVFPHHVIRENPLASGAGADRMSTGMAHSFGKPIGLAARVLEGAVICQVDVDEKNLELAKQSLKRFSSKLPGKCYTDVIDNVRKAKL
ncbi:50S ribosomal protein L16 [Candidatus Woesearchaeota archaeon]|nr:50S ribosomal protein L16 [Candidatus Woesearchaeota archaeon]